MRPAAQVLVLAAESMHRRGRDAISTGLQQPTPCGVWSVRDVLAHCSGSMARAVSGDLHGFTPADNEEDVDVRRSWPLDGLLDELAATTTLSANAVDGAAGSLDGIGIGVWVHAGDVRAGLGDELPYVGEGADLALDLLLERSRRQDLRVIVDIDGAQHVFGPENGPSSGSLETDLEGFVRIVAGRGPDPGTYSLTGVRPAQLLLFS